MFRKATFLFILVLGLGLMSLESWGSDLTCGKLAPAFLVKSGNNKKLTLDMVQGKVIVLFYESRHSLGKNAPLKDRLTDLYSAQPASIKKEIFRLVVIDCSEATWPTLPIWKSKLNQHSAIEGFTIYCDWTGNMFARYCMKKNESNFLIIDRQGIIRYSASGKINDKFDEIKELLLRLVKKG